jgi:hypothetical protein
VKDVRTNIKNIFAEIPEAIWSPGQPIPYVYRGKPIEMVQQMAREMGPGVTTNQAIDTLLDALARDGLLKLRITGNSPPAIRAGIFVHSLLQRGICRPMASA